MTHHNDDELAVWLADGPQHGSVQVREDALARVPSIRQRPRWLVSATGATLADGPSSGTMRFVILVATILVLTVLLAGALMAGGLLPRPAPSIIAVASPHASATAPTSTSPSPSPASGLVAYTMTEDLEPGQANCSEDGPELHCLVTRIWLANTDGTDAHALHPEEVQNEGLLGWSPDGSSILYQPGLSGDLVLVAPNGTELRRWTRDQLCAFPCTGMEGFSFSPDGTQLAFIRGYQDSTVIAVLELASGDVTDLASTSTTNLGLDQCPRTNQCEGFNSWPRWSPDGSRIAFDRQAMSPEPGSEWLSAAVFVVDADGANLERVTPTGLNATTPIWSPDGSRLAVASADFVPNRERTVVTRIEYDIYTMRPDGTDIQRLTRDRLSAWPQWTRDGRLAFRRQLNSGIDEPYENWIMDADGSNATRLGLTLAELTGAGCITCDESYWQPAR